tara:strand:- start:135 stop:878 length:744 start_codon:yes stop_codon:yes gene_type:complete
VIAQYILSLVAFLGCDPNPATSDAGPVIAAWNTARKDVHAVGASFVRYEYDSVFGTFTKCTGDVHFTTRQNGHWAFLPIADGEAPKKVQRGDSTYVFRKVAAQRYLWDGDVVTVIDENDKTYQRLPRTTSLFGTMLFPHVNAHCPFLPGLPDKEAIAEWTFTAISDSDDEIRLRAEPPSELDTRFRECEVILHKPHMNLYAVRYIDPTGNRESVFVFTAVHHNPTKSRTVDLENYTDAGTSVGSTPR